MHAVRLSVLITTHSAFSSPSHLNLLVMPDGWDFEFAVSCVSFEVGDEIIFPRLCQLNGGDRITQTTITTTFYLTDNLSVENKNCWSTEHILS